MEASISHLSIIIIRHPHKQLRKYQEVYSTHTFDSSKSKSRQESLIWPLVRVVDDVIPWHESISM